MNRWKTRARRRYPKALWIRTPEPYEQPGPYAVLAHCRGLTISLWPTRELAERVLASLGACGGGCVGASGHELVDLRTEPERQADAQDDLLLRVLVETFAGRVTTNNVGKWRQAAKLKTGPFTRSLRRLYCAGKIVINKRADCIESNAIPDGDVRSQEDAERG